MATINLIPPKIKRAQQAKRVTKLASSSLFSILIMILIVYGAIYLADTFIKSDLNAVNSDIAEAEFKLKSFKDIEDRIASVNSKITRLNTLKKQSIQWTDVFAKYNESVPEKVQISSMQIDSGTKKFTLGGTAPSRREIVRLQTKLEGSDYFANVTFGSSVFDEKLGTFSFSLTGDFTK